MRDAATILAVLGVLGLLVPGRAGRRDPRVMGAGLLATLCAWALLAGTLLPSGTADDLGGRLASPGVSALAVAGLALLAGLVWLAARLTAARPWLWFAALALALPIRLPVSVGDESAKLLVPLYFVILVGLAAVLLLSLRGERPDLDPPAPLVDLSIGLLTAFLVLSVMWSADAQEGVVKIVFFYVPFVLAYLVVTALWRKTAALRVLATTTLIAAVPIALLALWQYLARGVFWNESLIQANVYSQFYRVNSIFFDPNILGRYLVVAAVACIALAWVARDLRTLVLLAGVAAILLAGLFVTFSRSSALMLIVAVLLLAWRRFGARRTFAVAAVLLVAFAAVSFAASGQIRRAATSTERLDRVSEGRFDLVRGGVEIWREQPLRGAGLGSFAEVYRAQLTGREAVRTRVVISHNAPVTVLSEGGLVGIALLIATVVALAVAIVRRSRGTPDDGWFRWAILAVLAGIFVHTLLYSALFEDPYVWVLAAAALAPAAMRQAEAAPTA